MIRPFFTKFFCFSIEKAIIVFAVLYLSNTICYLVINFMILFKYGIASFENAEILDNAINLGRIIVNPILIVTIIFLFIAVWKRKPVYLIPWMIMSIIRIIIAILGVIRYSSYIYFLIEFAITICLWLTVFNFYCILKNERIRNVFSEECNEESDKF